MKIFKFNENLFLMRHFYGVRNITSLTLAFFHDVHSILGQSRLDRIQSDHFNTCNEPLSKFTYVQSLICRNLTFG